MAPRVPIAEPYFASWQVDEYLKVRKLHGETYAREWFYAKFGGGG